MIFVCCDDRSVFLEDVPDEWICRVWATMERCPWHNFQVLTKRPKRMAKWLDEVWYTGKVLPNVWLGVSVEDQQRANERIPILLDTPAAVRFLSAEPLLGPIEVPDCQWFGDGLIEWVICGGESGPSARPMHPDWARYLRDQCTFDGAAYFHKQNGEWLQGRDLEIGEAAGKGWKTHNWEPPAGQCGEVSYRVGKKRAGRLLDGRTWDEMPGGTDG